MIELIRDLKPPGYALREEYLASLAEPQEFFLERQIQLSDTVSIIDDGIPRGYAAIGRDNRLLEFWLEGELSSQADAILDNLMKRQNIEKILCKSFDRQLRLACTSLPLQMTISGFLFRKMTGSKYIPQPELILTAATEEDIEPILGINDGFFEDATEIRSYLKPEDALLLTLRGHERELIGCGIAKRVIPQKPDFDIGMLVAPHCRRKGYGTYILDYIKRDLMASGRRPIAGCSASNISSLRTLQKAGFVTQHQILEFAR